MLLLEALVAGDFLQTHRGKRQRVIPQRLRKVVVQVDGLRDLEVPGASHIAQTRERGLGLGQLVATFIDDFLGPGLDLLGGLRKGAFGFYTLGTHDAHTLLHTGLAEFDLAHGPSPLRPFGGVEVARHLWVRDHGDGRRRSRFAGGEDYKAGKES